MHNDDIQDVRQADEAILAALTAGPMSTADLAAKTGMILRRVQRRLRRLVAAGRVKKLGGGRYVLADGGRAAGQEDGARDPGNNAGGGPWFWQSMQADASQAHNEVLVPEVLPRGNRHDPIPVVSETDIFDKLRETFILGFTDGGGDKKEAISIAAKWTRYFLAESGLLGNSKLKDETVSELYSFAFGMGEEAKRQRIRQQQQRVQEQRQRHIERQQRIRAMWERREQAALAKKEAEFNRQVDLLSTLVKLIETQVENDNIPLKEKCETLTFEIYDILREHGIPPTKWQTWIHMAAEVYQYKQQYSQKLEAYFRQLLHR